MVAEDNATLLVRGNTKADILRAVEEAGRNMGPDDTLYVTNSSHGASNAMLCASDADITPAEMSAALAKSGCGKIVFCQ